MLMPLIWLLSAAASNYPAEAPVLTGHTEKSVQEFGLCFMTYQERHSRPSWFVLHPDGGRISNEGAARVSNPYWIRFTERDRRNRVQLFMSRADRAEEQALVDAVKRCW